MKLKALKQGLNVFNLLFVATFLVLALYSAIGQQIFPHIGQYRVTLEQYLSDQLDGVVNIRNLAGDMDVLTPSIHMEGITLHTPDRPNHAKISIAAIDAVLDPRLSLINLTPVFRSVRLSGLYVHLDGETQKPNRALEDDDVVLIKQFVDSLLLQHHVELNNVTIENERNGEINSLFLRHLTMTGDGYHHLITGNVSYGDEEKVDAGLRLYSKGSPFELEGFYARGALDLPDVDVDYWIREIFDVSIFNEFSASAQLRFEFKDSLLNYAKLTAASPKVDISDRGEVGAARAELWVKQKAINNWSFWLEDTKFKLNGQPWSFKEIGIGVAKLDGASRWQGYAKALDLVYVQDFMNALNIIPEQAQPILNELAVTGAVENLNVVLQPKSEDSLSFTVVSQLAGVSSQASGGIPSVTNLNGILAVNNKGGRVQFEGDDLTLEFPNIYELPFQFKRGKGQVDWSILDSGFHLKGSGLSVSMENTQSIRGGFQTWFYNDPQLEDKLELNLSLTDANVLAHKDLVPKLVSSRLRGWLDKALLGGHGRSGQFYMLAGLDKGSIYQTELSLSVLDGQLEYLAGWPRLSDVEGDLLVQNDHVFAAIKSAKTLGGDAQRSQVVYDGINKNQLWIKTLVNGNASEGLDYFQQTPLSEVINNVAKDWQANGLHQTRFGMMVPLSEANDQILVDVESQLKDTSLNIVDINLDFSDTKGQVSYTSSKGLFSNHLTSSLWQEPINLAINSQIHELGLSTDIGFNGWVSASRLKKWLDLSILQPASGRTQVSGKFRVSAQANDYTGLTLKSDLVGVALDLPEPYLKAPDAVAPIQLNMELDEGQKLSIKYDKKANIALHLKQGSIHAGQVYLGATEAYIPSESGLEVLGHIPSLDLLAWHALWDEIKPAQLQTQVESSNIFRTAQLSTDRLIFDDFEAKQVKVDILQANSVYQFNIQSPLVKGLATWQEGAPTKLNLEYIHWPSLDGAETKDKQDEALANIYPQQIPELDVNVAEIFVGATNYGAWQGRLRTDDRQVSLSEIKGKIKKMDVAGNIHWQKNKEQSVVESTQVKLSVSSKDVGGIQKAWRAKPVIESKDAKVNVDLTWDDNPLAFNTELLNGTAALNLKDGRFLEAGDAQGLSAFGLLNFAAIGRRLRLDFSDVYQSGLHFDSVTGKFKIEKGVMNIVDTMDIKGPSAKFAASGTVNLNNKQLNQELSVTFPITSTLPFVAILAGFAPPVAASLFVGEQLVGDQIEKFTSATYRLSGSWDEPNLNLMKRFDNKIEGKQNTGFWYRMKDFFGLGGDD
ncbi:YhdP family protein [Oceaniserpentilla sp. 4NH20-0058]|uniref:YhdP family protein n=1 Tax=Oceaniserpentilla sp. 4NH20-0058 TaxID=3127660 RepID=UPI003107AF2A